LAHNAPLVIADSLIFYPLHATSVHKNTVANIASQTDITAQVLLVEVLYSNKKSNQLHRITIFKPQLAQKDVQKQTVKLY
jgi:hypothetical protein